MLSSSSFNYIGKGNNIENYRTVKIGNQVWMAENLDYNVSGSFCFTYIEGIYYYTSAHANSCVEYCEKYGRLYDWATAMALPATCNSDKCASQISTKHRGVCPSGWHIPSRNEWTTLVNFVGGASTASTKLKSREGWNNNGNGTDEYGFSALPGGHGLDYNYGYYTFGLGDASWWSSSESDTGAFTRQIDAFISPMRENSLIKFELHSVRCVKD